MVHSVIVGLLVVLETYKAMRVGACSTEFDVTALPNNATGSVSLPCTPNYNSSQCSNASSNCTAEGNGSQQGTVALGVLVGSGIGIISVTALIFIPIAVAASVLKQKRHRLRQGRRKVMRRSTRKKSKKSSQNESKSIVNQNHVYETVLPMPNTFPRRAEPQARMYEVPLSLTLTRFGKDTSAVDRSFLKTHNSRENCGPQSTQDEKQLTPSSPQEVVYMNWRQKNTDLNHDCPSQFCAINDTHLGIFIDSPVQKEGMDDKDLLDDSWVMLAQKIAGHTNTTTQDTML